MLQRLKINQFYGAPTVIRLLLKYGDHRVQKYDRSTLKTVGTVDEPINMCTETSGICIPSRPSQPETDCPRNGHETFLGIKPVLKHSENTQV